MSNIPGDPNANPYAAPVAQPGVASDKGARVNMINRRSTAVVLELAVWYGTVGPIVQAILLKFLPASVAPYVSLGIYYCLRDFIPVAASARSLMGLRLVSGDG